jgi:hypothetical protein
MYRSDKTEQDVKFILANLRIEDMEESKALWGEDYQTKMLENIMNTENVIIGKTKRGDIPVLMGGVCRTDPYDKSVGCIWLLATPEIQNHQICLLRELKKEITKYDEEFWLMYNIIYKENYLAKSWLAWLGFKFDNPKPQGMKIPDGFEFFYRVRPVKGLGNV